MQRTSPNVSPQRMTPLNRLVIYFAQTSGIVLAIAENWTVTKALRHSRRVLPTAHRSQGTADGDPTGFARPQPEPARHPRTGCLRCGNPGSDQSGSGTAGP